MRINYNLVSPKAKLSSIRIVISHKGKVYRKSVGISCYTSDWSVKKQRCSDPVKENKLKEIKHKLEKYLNDFSNETEVINVLDWALSNTEHDYQSPRKKNNFPTFWDYFESFVERPYKTKKSRRSLYNKVKSLMDSSDDWNDINSAWYTKLNLKMDSKNIARNTQGYIIALIKTVMKEGHMLKYHNNMDYILFKRKHESNDTIYLTQEEIDILWNAKFDDYKLEKIRDLFLIGVYTISRFSDYSKFSKDNIVRNTFRFTQQKKLENQ